MENANWTVEHWDENSYVLCKNGSPIGQVVSKNDGRIILNWLNTLDKKPVKDNNEQLKFNFAL